MTKIRTEPFRLLLPFICILISYACAAQEFLPDSDEKFGPGTTVRTVKSSDDAGTESTITEYKDADGYVRRKHTSRKFIQGHSETTDSTFTRGGRLEIVWVYTTDRSDRVNYVYNRVYNRGKLVSGSTITVTRNADGSATEVTTDAKTGAVQTRDLPAAETREIERRTEENIREGSIQSCAPTSEIFLGYSLMNADYGMERETYPLGVNVGYTRFLNRKLGIVVDASIHSKKENDYSDRQIYFGVGVRMDFAERECEPSVRPFGNFLVGLRNEASFYNGNKMGSGTDFALLAGGGINYNPSRDLDLTLAVNYNPVFAYELQHNFRATIGVRYCFLPK